MASIYISVIRQVREEHLPILESKPKLYVLESSFQKTEL